MIRNLIWLSREEIQHCWLLLSPENLKYILSILWVLSLVESYQDSTPSRGQVPYVTWVSPMCLGTLFCESHVYHKIIGVIYMHWAYISNFGHVSPRWSTICQLWPWMTPMSGYPLLAESFRYKTSPIAIPAQWHTAFSPMMWGIAEVK